MGPSTLLSRTHSVTYPFSLVTVDGFLPGLFILYLAVKDYFTGRNTLPLKGLVRSLSYVDSRGEGVTTLSSMIVECLER